MENKILISIIIPSFNTPENHLNNLYISILAQTCKNFEVIIIDDNSDFNYYHIIEDDRFKIIYNKRNYGPAKTRNKGAIQANGEIFFFTDSDCELSINTLDIISRKINDYKVIMGNTITKVNTVFGKGVASLGIPGGGIIGFDKVWKVKNGYTENISSCNLAITKKIFFEAGCFDTSFPVAGGEDTVFGKQLIRKGYMIKYMPEQIVYHVERNNWKSFANWQMTRGRGVFYIRKKLGSIKHFTKVILNTFYNSLKYCGFLYIPLVMFLFFSSVYFHIKGYKLEAEIYSNKHK